MNRLKDQIAALEAIVQKQDNEIKAIRAEARAEALMKVEDLIHKWWFDDGDSIETLIKAIKELKP
jgi:hypothetical protein